MMNLHESYAAELGFELATPGSAVRHATDCAMQLGIYTVESFHKSDLGKAQTGCCREMAVMERLDI